MVPGFGSWTILEEQFAVWVCLSRRWNEEGPILQALGVLMFSEFRPAHVFLRFCLVLLGPQAKGPRANMADFDFGRFRRTGKLRDWEGAIPPARVALRGSSRDNGPFSAA